MTQAQNDLNTTSPLAKFDPASVTWLMVVFGLGLFLGNILGGRYADKALMPLLYLTLGAQAIVLLIFSQTAHSQIMSVACILLMAGFGFATVSPIQKLVMDKARAAGAPTLASAVNIGLFGVHRENGKNRTISPADSLQALRLCSRCPNGVCLNLASDRTTEVRQDRGYFGFS